MAVIKRVRLSEIAELVTKGTTPTTLGYEFQDTGVNFLKIECFSEKGDYIQNKATHISEECHEKLKRSQLKEGDILFSIAGVIGRVAIVTRNMCNLWFVFHLITHLLQLCNKSGKAVCGSHRHFHIGFYHTA